MGVINSPLVEGGVFSEEVNKKEVTVFCMAAFHFSIF